MAKSVSFLSPITLPLLRAADTNSGLVWTQLNNPIIRRLAADPEFIVFKTGFYEHLNAQRAMLGWPPVGENE